MARRSDALLLFDALAIEGGLLPPEWLAKVAALEASPQKPAYYHVPKGLELRDEITRYWRIAEALHADYVIARAHARDGAAAATKAFVYELLSQVFGFTDLAPAGRREVGGRGFDIAFEALGGCVPVLVGVPGDGLDTAVIRHGDGGRRRSAWGALQEYLNASDDVLWGVVTNGVQLRIGRDNTSLTRPAWIEADLQRMFDEERFADFSVLWLMLHASRFGRPGALPAECPLETWRDAAREAGTRARDQLRDGVEAALLALGRGFLAHPQNAALRQALASGELTPTESFNELLRLVYRMIFLLTIEERGFCTATMFPRKRARSMRRATACAGCVSVRCAAASTIATPICGRRSARYCRHWVGAVANPHSACRSSVVCSRPVSALTSTRAPSRTARSSRRRFASRGCANNARSRASTGRTWVRRSWAVSTSRCWSWCRESARRAVRSSSRAPPKLQATRAS